MEKIIFKAIIFLVFVSGASFAVPTVSKYVLDDEYIDGLFEKGIQDTDTIPMSSDQSSAVSPCLHSFSLGEEAAHQKKLMEWAIISAPVAVCTGACSSVCLPLAAVRIKNEPDYYPPGVDRECYRKGWQMETLRNRNKSIAIGSAVGVITFTMAYIAFYFYLISVTPTK